MANLGLLYIDGVSAVSGKYTISNSDTYTVTSTGITFTGSFMSGQSGAWTYSGSGTFAGFATTSGATTPHTNLEIGDSGTFNDSTWWGSGGVELYTVEASTYSGAYITSDIDLTSVANAIRTKGGTSASLVYPAGYVSAINALPIGTLQSYKSVIYTSPGTATILPDSGYVGIEEISVEYSPAIYDGSYHSEGVTDLMGTTWYFNEELQSSDPYFSGDIFFDRDTLNFTSNGRDYNGFYFVDNEIVGYYYGSRGVDSPYEDGWTNQAYRTIVFTGGSGCTDTNFIAWLQANATQIS